MATQNGPNFTSLDPRLFDDDDDAEDLSYKQILNGLVTQITTPSQAAGQIDEWVVSEANRKYEQFKGRDPPFELSEEEKDFIYVMGPNPNRSIDMIIGCVARLCSAFPPNHPTQDALVEFFQQLNALPKHEVPTIAYNVIDIEFSRKISLWPLGTSDTKFLVTNSFRREAEELAYPYSDVEIAGSEYQLRWRNLQSFISRLTTLGLIDCSFISALFYILPSAHTYPDLKERKIGGPRRIASDLVAASHWLISDQACQWVYMQCRRVEAMEGNALDRVWSMENWRQWKSQVSFFATDGRFSEETCLLARSLGEKMDAQEQIS